MRKKIDPGARAIEFFQNASIDAATQVLEIAKLVVANRAPRLASPARKQRVQAKPTAVEHQSA